MGGHLAIVNSKGEDDFLAAISRGHVWLGATDAEKEGQWVWIDGTPMTYSNWDYGEPNNARDPRTGKRENYLMISKYGRWNDLTEDSPVINGFVCEWDIAGPPAPRPASSAEDLHAALKQWNPQYNGKGILELRDCTIRGAILVHTGVTNLTPLRGLSLSSLDISWSDITDLSPLENVPLARLQASWSKVSDISSLAGMPLTELRIDGTAVKDLTPLKGMPLTYLDISHSRITDLSPLAGMPLEELHMNCVKVTDLSPLAGMPLQRLGMLDTPARDAAPLEKCASLESVALPLTIRNLDSLRRLPGLKFVNGDRAEPFWREHPGIWTNAQPSSAAEVR
jgi:hypothetical protein